MNLTVAELVRHTMQCLITVNYPDIVVATLTFAEIKVDLSRPIKYARTRRVGLQWHAEVFVWLSNQLNYPYAIES